MNPEVKQKWLTALRSGEYKQGTGALRSIDDEYCCLGVLCDLYAKEFNVEWDKLLPEKAFHWARITETGDIPYPIENTRRLDRVNDRLGYNFNQIADVIERQL